MYGCESWIVKKAELPKNWCFWTVVLEKTLESPLNCKEIQSVHSEGDQPWDFFGRNDAKAETPILATLCKELTHRKRLWFWEGLGAGGEGDNRGWDGWMASPTWWTWVWVNSERWWWTGKPGVLRFMGLQRVRHDWETELNWRKNGIPHKGQLIIQWYCRNTEWIMGKNKPPKAMSSSKTYLTSKSIMILPSVLSSLERCW